MTIKKAISPIITHNQYSCVPVGHVWPSERPRVDLRMTRSVRRTPDGLPQEIPIYFCRGSLVASLRTVPCRPAGNYVLARRTGNKDAEIDHVSRWFDCSNCGPTCTDRVLFVVLQVIFM